MGLAGSAWGRLAALGMAGVSPAFVTFLVLKVRRAWHGWCAGVLTPSQVSGVPMSENKYDKRYGDRKDYQEWKKNTPVFIPKW